MPCDVAIVGIVLLDSLIWIYVTFIIVVGGGMILAGVIEAGGILLRAVSPRITRPPAIPRRVDLRDDERVAVWLEQRT